MAKVNQQQFAQAFIPTSATRPQQPGMYRQSDQEIGFSGGVRMERGWRDLEGALVPKTSGVGSPTLTTFRGNIRWFAYAAGEDMDDDPDDHRRRCEAVRVLPGPPLPVRSVQHAAEITGLLPL